MLLISAIGIIFGIANFNKFLGPPFQNYRYDGVGKFVALASFILFCGAAVLRVSLVNSMGRFMFQHFVIIVAAIALGLAVLSWGTTTPEVYCAENIVRCLDFADS